MQEGFEAAFLSEGAAQRSDAASAEIPSSHQGTFFFLTAALLLMEVMRITS